MIDNAKLIYSIAHSGSFLPTGKDKPTLNETGEFRSTTRYTELFKNFDLEFLDARKMAIHLMVITRSSDELQTQIQFFVRSSLLYR